MIVLLWQAGWNRNTSFGKSEPDEHVEALLFHHVAADDADIELLVDLVLERADQQPEFGKVVLGAAEVDVLVLKPDALLGRFDQLQRLLARSCPA